MLKRYRSAAVGLGALLISGVVAFAAGSFSTLPLIGGASYCASTVSGTGGLTGVTGQGQGTTGSLCAQTVPAGPATFAGTEYVPMDIGPLGSTASPGSSPQSAVVSMTQLGQGPMLDVTTVLTAQTIPANTPFYFLDGAQASALTVTMPAAPIEGYIQRVYCTAATVGVLTVAANGTQSLKNNPAAACVAGVGYAWRYQASNTTWYRFQ